LKERDTRLVEAVMPSAGLGSTADVIGNFLLPKAPVDGEVVKIDEDYIHIKGTDGTVHQVDYENNLPLATKTLLNNTITVAVGDKVRRGDVLADNNFTKDKKLALGKNLSVAYMPYHGLNHEDGIVISESAAKKMTSVHADRVSVTLDGTKIIDRSKFVAQFPTTFTVDQLNKLDKDGVVKKGVVLEEGDPIILVMSSNADSKVNQVLGKLHKSLIAPYRDESEVYDQHYPAKVLEVLRAGKTTTVLLEMEKPAALGDKLSGSYGNKGVITRILPTEQMPTDESGEPVDAVVTSAGVIGRISPAQSLEAALG
jgi:DNA-directed RNA polymerase subunit beta